MKTANTNPQRPGTRALRTLSSGPMGQVSRCPEGCVHVDTRNVSLRLTEPMFLALAEMISQAASELARERSSPRVH